MSFPCVVTVPLDAQSARLLMAILRVQRAAEPLAEVGPKLHPLPTASRRDRGASRRGKRVADKPDAGGLPGRDGDVLRLVARFKQMSAAQVHELLFDELSSHTPANRTLRRLTERGYLSRIERRMVGGSRGGSGQYVYQLGRRGFYAYCDGRYSPWRTVNYHSLGIVDVFVQLRRLERSGVLSIAGYSTEPDCWVTVGGDELKPDMFAELDLRGSRYSIWFEVDMATEGQKQLRAKLDRYWRAYNAADWPVFPRVVWAAVDQERAKELRWLVSQLPEDRQVLHVVTTISEVGALLGG